MGNRLALIVCSQCDPLPHLEFLPELAQDLAAVLVQHGDWLPVFPNGIVVADPSSRQLENALSDAVQIAAEQNATLLLAFLGYGEDSADGDFCYLCRDSRPPDPYGERPLDLRFTVRIPTFVRDLVAMPSASGGPDGLIMLVDTCHTGAGGRTLAPAWPDRLLRAPGRMELFVATGIDPAFGGCSTRSLLGAVRSGLPGLGDWLLPTDLLGPIAQDCGNQRPQYLSSAAGLRSAADPGLWLAHNLAPATDVLSGRPEDDIVADLTRHLLVTGGVTDRLAALAEHGDERLQAIVGPGGSGKSTLAALLARSRSPDAGGVPVDAAVFLTGTSDRTTVARDLGEQLVARVEDMETTATVDNPTFDADVIPESVHAALSKLGAAEVIIVVDGLDLPTERGKREAITAMLTALATRPEYDHVRLIVTDSQAPPLPDLPDIQPFEAPLPSCGEVEHYLRAALLDDEFPWSEARFAALWIAVCATADPARLEPDCPWPVPGGWLHARLIAEIAPELDETAYLGPLGIDELVGYRIESARTALGGLESGPTAADLDHLLVVLLAAEPGPVLPIEVLCLAAAELGSVLTEPDARQLIAGLGAMVRRCGPGTPAEHLGIAHRMLWPSLLAMTAECDIPPLAAHRAILLASERSGTVWAAAYREVAGVRHHLDAEDPDGALSLLAAVPTAGIGERLALWRSWLPSFEDGLGTDHAVVRRVRNTIRRMAIRHGRGPMGLSLVRGAVVGAIIILLVGLGGWALSVSPKGTVDVGPSVEFTSTAGSRPIGTSSGTTGPVAPPTTTPRTVPRTTVPRTVPPATIPQTVPPPAPPPIPPPAPPTTETMAPTTTDTVIPTTTPATTVPPTTTTPDPTTTTATDTTTTTTSPPTTTTVSAVVHLTPAPPSCADLGGTLAFGPVSAGNIVQRDVTLPWSDCYVRDALVTTDPAVYRVLATTCPPAKPGGTCSITVGFRPASAGAVYSAQLAILDRSGQVRGRIALQGSGAR
ncbi:hypothetical protein [Nocardia terpenica]|uniref:ATP-binding cassette domain-containing protein n=1 Tax=Nocardia terpenica TaxID=455432 RepID=A0A6G9Z990_9NOCA|nr:hypothetical protein [Nocardia terpenica]QIS21583.1 ATP-binding cassette domain-containing protein [Nocardia terpenica]